VSASHPGARAAAAPRDAAAMPVPVVSEGRAIAVVRRAIDVSLQRLLAADPVARIGHDTEGVHQARVATRRLRCDLRTFAPLLDAEWASSLREEVRWLGEQLGVAREAEVLLGHLRERARALPPEIELAVAPLLDVAVEDREAAQAHVLDVLRSSRYLGLVDRLVLAAMAPRIRPGAAAVKTRDLTRLARRPWTRLRRDYHALGPEPSDPALHALRIRAKRARYAVEAVADAVGGAAPHALAARLTDLQDVLGAHQDAVVAQSWLAARVTDPAIPRSGPEIYAAGMLAGLLRADAIASAGELAGVWHRLNRPRLRSWL
jgi:CHAD domain-containing protein